MNLEKPSRTLFSGTRSAARKKHAARNKNTVVRIHSRGATEYILQKRQGSGGFRRRTNVPYFWRNICPLLSSGATDENRINRWLLVIAAKKIPHILLPRGKNSSIYVPPLYAGIATHEIRAFEKEKALPVFTSPSQENTRYVLLFLALLVVWHGIRWKWFTPISLPAPPFPAPEQWSVFFGLDAVKTVVYHEWWRTVTALTLHGDEKHLLGNFGFGLFFLIPLCRRVGAGIGVSAAVLAGILGNVVNVLTKTPPFLSVGFSTALFGALGCLCAVSFMDVVQHHKKHASLVCVPQSRYIQAFARHIFVPVAAGLALLGLLGGGGEVRTDYAAHIWGFWCGIVVGFFFFFLTARVATFPVRLQKRQQALFFISSCSVLAGAWLYALL